MQKRHITCILYSYLTNKIKSIKNAKTFTDVHITITNRQYTGEPASDKRL